MENEIEQILTKIKNPEGALWDDATRNKIWVEVESSLKNPILLGIEESKKFYSHLFEIDRNVGIPLGLESIQYLWGMPVTALYRDKQFCGIKIESNEAYRDWKGNLEFDIVDARGRPKRKFKNLLHYIRSLGD